MYKVQEFVCDGCHKLDELFVDSHEPEVIFICNECGDKMNKCLSATKGYVKGTDNPVKM